MAIPKSTFVMGALVLGLFGLAIRETAAKKDAMHDRDRDDDDDEYGDDEDSEEAMAAYEADEARRAAERRAEEANEQLELDKLIVSMRTLYGAEAASMGTVFAGVTLDAPKDELPARTEDALRTFRDTTDSDVTLGDLVGRGSIYEVAVSPNANGDYEQREQVCDKLGRSLRDAWGTGVKDGSGDTTIWLNPSTLQRATFEAGTHCALRFERYVPPAQWLARTPTSIIPLSLIGQSATQAAAAVGSSVDDDDTISWIRPGVGAGISPTRLIASIVKGKVVAVTASTTANGTTVGEIEEHLKATFGTPKPAATSYSVELVYPSKPPIELDESEENRVLVVVGKLP